MHQDCTWKGETPWYCKSGEPKNLTIHREEIRGIESIQENQIFQVYHDYVPRYLVIQACDTKFQMKYYITPDGKYVWAKLPKELAEHYFVITLRELAF